ncbi:MAG: hypothetical protein JWM59_1510 [Verrucomicrobiales bacterium]|nr:hypothetical protein [Verrucomicrobiales bacterium]
MAALLPVPAQAQRFDYEEEPHNYYSAPLTDAGTKLDGDLLTGSFQLPGGSDLEALKAVLNRLKIPVSSQVLVFSKTSVQRDRIRPDNPRAIYFNDECYAAWVPGGLVEIASTDPVLGPVFYTLDLHRADRTVPRLDRSQSCLDCHGGSMTNGVPGLMARSVFSGSDGTPLYQAGTALIDQNSPFENRWGGWYVTGTHGGSRHRGNVTATANDRNTVTMDTAKGANLESLESFFPVRRYARADSDIVALMVMEHQLGMTSRLVEASYAVRGAMVRQADLRRELGDPPTDELVGTAKIIADSHAGKILEYLLFAGEAALPEGGIEGGADFQAGFRAGRPATPDGKSLTDFQLLTRLFKYRCSYLIYSRLWDTLPPEFLALLYQRLFAILTAETPPPRFAHLSARERRDILQILRTTKPGLPDSWQ